LQAIAGKHQPAADFFGAGHRAGGEDQADTVFQGQALAAEIEQRRLAFAGEAAFGEIDPLIPGAGVACRLQAQPREMPRDIICGNLVTAAAEAAAFQQIIGQKGDMGAERGRQRIGRRLGKCGSGCGDERQGGEGEDALVQWRYVSGALDRCKPSQIGKDRACCTN